MNVNWEDAIQLPTQVQIWSLEVGWWTTICHCTKGSCSFFSLLFCLVGLLPLDAGGRARWGQDGPPGQGQDYTGCGAPGVQSGHEATAVLSLPSHRFAGLFRGVEAAGKKLKIGNGSRAADLEEV